MRRYKPQKDAQYSGVHEPPPSTLRTCVGPGRGEEGRGFVEHFLRDTAVLGQCFSNLEGHANLVQTKVLMQ